MSPEGAESVAERHTQSGVPRESERSGLGVGAGLPSRPRASGSRPRGRASMPSQGEVALRCSRVVLRRWRAYARPALG